MLLLEKSCSKCLRFFAKASVVACVGAPILDHIEPSLPKVVVERIPLSGRVASSVVTYFSALSDNVVRCLVCSEFGSGAAGFRNLQVALLRYGSDASRYGFCP